MSSATRGLRSQTEQKQKVTWALEFTSLCFPTVGTVLPDASFSRHHTFHTTNQNKPRFVTVKRIASNTAWFLSQDLKLQTYTGNMLPRN